MTVAMQRTSIVVDIAYDDFLPFYEGRASDVVVTDLMGRSVRLPASALKPFLTHAGINGIFELTFSDTNKLISCERTGNLPLA